MNKIYVICILSALLLTGCKGISDKKTESSSDTAMALVTKDSLEESVNDTEFEAVPENTATAVDNNDEPEIAVTAPTINQNQKSDFSDDMTQEKFSIINKGNHKSKSEITTSVSDTSKKTTTTIVTHDDVIELPFVPVR